VTLENAQLHENATRREQELAEKWALLQAALEHLSPAVSVFDKDLRLAAWNTHLLDLLGFPQEFGRVGKPLADFLRYNAERGEYGPGDPEDHVAQRVALALRFEPHRFERVRPDGTVVEVRGSPMPNGGFVTTYTDITEGRRGEEALQKSEARYRAIVEDQTELICRFLPNGRLTFVNEACCRYFGKTRQELIGQSFVRLLADEDRWEKQITSLTRENPVATLEHRVVLPSGEIRWQQWTTRAIFDEHERFVEFQSVGRDTTERKRAEDALRQSEEHLRQAQKMEAIGRLAGGVAHDFNNLLTVITGRSELLLRRLGPDEPFRRQVELIQQTAFRAADLIRQLLAFSRKQMLQPKVLDLNAVVAGMEGMLRRLIGEHIELVSLRDPMLGQVKADPGQLEQVIMNLAVNARDAMPQGGALTIWTANVDLDGAFTRSHAGARPGPYVMLAVEDTGVGMDADTRAHVFEPFFTTKGPGKGTGLGLATVYGIVKQSGGYVLVKSEPGQGSQFEIYLPRLEEPVDAPEEAIARSGLPRGSETVLLVEDQDEVRDLAREILEMSGYTVLEARHGREALLVCERHAGPLHLLLTDVVMPHMGGRELADRLAPAYPGLKVLYMSGYTEDAIVHHGVLDPGTSLLQKPFTSDVLAKRVRDLLDAAG